jgi:ELWxxDGT repeat protein
MVKDIKPGTAGSGPGNLMDVNGTLFFNANDGVHGSELWKSDGTEAGTVLVKDVNPLTTCDDSGYNPGSGTYPCSFSPGGLGAEYYQAVLAGRLFFAAFDGSHGAELWVSDGTEAGTMLVKDINPLATCDEWGENPGSGTDACSSDLDNLTEGSGNLFFAADDGSHGKELWVLEVDIPSPCVEISLATVVQVTADPIYPHTAVELSAAIEPITATAPYSYTLNGGVTMTTTETTIAFSRTFASTGTHTVAIAAWNCAMAVPVTDTVDVEVRARTVYLPIVRRQ